MDWGRSVDVPGGNPTGLQLDFALYGKVKENRDVSLSTCRVEKLRGLLRFWAFCAGWGTGVL
ncbi:hypothetical protein M407DRAFT_243855 [Tulasnella calospora MUT 4182]|uniref:Uncharacterized protein n=1 Tax=Tulasnella calospora MUT 4182 TaxID=1051891 RepID=A0A0C3Q8C3_9AGAM|nr:hypothetical protein M407DRAFT_243855 [Tulasnella calospora MUT 4182]